MSKLVTDFEAVKPVKDGDSIMVGGFGRRGYPGRVLRALLVGSRAKDFRVICNSTSAAYPYLEKLIGTKAVELVASFISGSKVAKKLFEEGRVELVPQGTLAERIRAGAFGIPAFYTPVGVGTAVENGKEKKVFGDQEYLMEEALRADVAIIKANQVDLDGNCYMRRVTKSFSVHMAAAAKYTIVEAEEIVPVGAIDPDMVSVPGIFVDAIVKVGD